MDVAKISFLFGLITVCSALKSWEIPTGNLIDYVNHDLTADWIRYKKDYNKTYGGSNEELRRRYIWENHRKFLDDHNRLYKEGKKSYTVGENDFSDMTEDEFEEVYLKGLIVPENWTTEYDFQEETIKRNVRMPSYKNWLKEGKVTPVRNQGQCGSCWAFSAVGAIESAILIKRHRRVDLSEQNLVDCASYRRGYRCFGCRGGWMNEAFKYVKKSGGLDTEVNYRYMAREQYCRFNARKSTGRLKGYIEVKRNEYSLQQAVAKEGPIAIAANVNSPRFWNYRSGVFDEPSCSKTPTHAMLLVGYGTENGRQYWLVKNSWGTRWGDQGYIKMTRNKNNQCGIAGYASYPVLA